ncbi:MAG: FKBP-type peptidyl-prolyl cis-trans isomerase [Phycisphaerae bacterium]
MGKRAAAGRSLVMGAALVMAGVAIGLYGCDRSGDKTVVAPHSPAAAPPSTADAAVADEPVRSDVERIPELGVSQAFKIGEEVWSKYPNGIMTYIIRPGSGLHAQAGETMHVQYKGMFPNGQVFDQSKPGKPFTFVLGTHDIIEGWNLVVNGMAVGEKRKVFIPSKFAYGVRGNLPAIHPNQDLVFEIELVSITGKPVEFPETKPAETESLEAPKMGPSAPAATKPE